MTKETLTGMSLIEIMRCDWKRNSGNPKGQLITSLFRVAHAASTRRPGLKNLIYLCAIPYLLFYRISVEWILGVELPQHTKVGPGLRIFHGQSLVVNDHAIIGANCTLRHSSTIGNTLLPDGKIGPSPVIEDDVELGSNVVIIGGVIIGRKSIVGAGSVVVSDVPAGSVVVGNPARIIHSVVSSNNLS